MEMQLDIIKIAIDNVKKNYDNYKFIYYVDAAIASPPVLYFKQ